MSGNKYHIDKNGKPAICKANIKACPCGTPREHFNNIHQAQNYADAINALTAEVNKYNKPLRIIDKYKKDSPQYIKYQNSLEKIKELENKDYSEEYAEFSQNNNLNYDEFKKEFLKNNKEYKDCSKYVNKLNKRSFNKIEYDNKPSQVFKKNRPLFMKLKKAKEQLQKHEDVLWQQEFQKEYMKNILNPPSRHEFKANYLKYNQNYLKDKKNYEAINNKINAIKNEREYLTNMLHKFPVKPIIVTYSNASASSYFIFHEEDKENIINFLEKQMNDDSKIKDIKILTKREGPFKLRIADHTRKFDPNSIVDISVLLDKNKFI